MSRAAESEAHDDGPGGTLGAQVSTRRFVTLAVAAFAVAFWMFIAMRVFRSQLPGGSVEAAVENVTAGGTGERWYSFYLTFLAWGHVPALFLILLLGVGLTFRSLVESLREPLDAQGLPQADRDEDRYVPVGPLCFFALIIGALTFNASGLVVLGPEAPLWTGDYSVAQWAALGWWALALVAALGSLVGAARRRSVRQRMQGTAEARQAAEARAAVIEQQLSGGPGADANRAGRGESHGDGDKERTGGDTSPWSVLALIAGTVGLGPVGLLAGVAGRLGQRTSSWLGTLGMSLSAVQTIVLAVALALALATG